MDSILGESNSENLELPENIELSEECPPSMKMFKTSLSKPIFINLNQLDVLRAIGFVTNTLLSKNSYI